MAPFTVKRECVNYLLSEDIMRRGSVERWEDGTGKLKETIPVEDFLRKEGYE